MVAQQPGDARRDLPGRGAGPAGPGPLVPGAQHPGQHAGPRHPEWLRLSRRQRRIRHRRNPHHLRPQPELRQGHLGGRAQHGQGGTRGHRAHHDSRRVAGRGPLLAQRAGARPVLRLRRGLSQRALAAATAHVVPGLHRAAARIERGHVHGRPAVPEQGWPVLPLAHGRGGPGHRRAGRGGDRWCAVAPPGAKALRSHRPGR